MAEKQKPVPVYIVKRTSPVACGCGVLMLLVLIIGIASTGGDNTRPARTSTAPSSETPVETPAASTADPTPQPGLIPDTSRPIIGLTRDEVLAKFPYAERNYAYERNVDEHALKLETDQLLIIVYFDAAGVAEGVSFLSGSQHLGDSITGAHSYVHSNYNMLIQNATGGLHLPIKHNTSTKFPVDIHIGNCHDDY